MTFRPNVISAMRAFRPYLSAGVGTIGIDQGSRRESHLIFAGGAGVVLPRIGRLFPFSEGRFHHAMTGAPNDFIPLSLGVAFQCARDSGVLACRRAVDEWVALRAWGQSP